jgi:hypothetical protein
MKEKVDIAETSLTARNQIQYFLVDYKINDQDELVIDRVKTFETKNKKMKDEELPQEF